MTWEEAIPHIAKTGKCYISATGYTEYTAFQSHWESFNGTREFEFHLSGPWDDVIDDYDLSDLESFYLDRDGITLQSPESSLEFFVDDQDRVCCSDAELFYKTSWDE